MPRSLLRPLSIALVLLLNASCFSYRPAASGMPKRATALRVHLSTAAAFDIGEIVVQNVRQVEGEMIGWSGDTLSLSATLLISGTDQEFFGNGRTVSISRSQIARLEQRRLSVGRSAFVAGAGFLLLVATERVIGRIGRTSEDDSDGGGNTQ